MLVGTTLNCVTRCSKLVMKERKNVTKDTKVQKQWPSGQEHWVPNLEFLDSRTTQPFNLPWLIKWVIGIPGDSVVRSKLSPHSGSPALRYLNSIIKWDHKVFPFKKHNKDRMTPLAGALVSWSWTYLPN